MKETGGSLGFVRPDNGEQDMAVLPLDCFAFDNHFPREGERVVFSVGKFKSGDLGDADVQPEKSPMFACRLIDRKGKFGFIRPDNGNPPMFVSPQDCFGFDGKLPGVGERVVFSVIMEGVARFRHLRSLARGCVIARSHSIFFNLGGCAGRPMLSRSVPSPAFAS